MLLLLQLQILIIVLLFNFVSSSSNGNSNSIVNHLHHQLNNNNNNDHNNNNNNNNNYDLTMMMMTPQEILAPDIIDHYLESLKENKEQIQIDDKNKNKNKNKNDSKNKPLGFLLRNLTVTETEIAIPLHENSSQWMSNITNIRLGPGLFPEGMKYHFDGLASIFRLHFDKGVLKYKTIFYQSHQYQHYEDCLIIGTGSIHLGERKCFANPLVNLLPINEQLWLTIDTSAWGRIENVDTLATMDTQKQRTVVPTITLNAHPACDPTTGKCYVEHPCSERMDVKVNANQMDTDHVCVSELHTHENDMTLTLVSKQQLPQNHRKFIQHSHSPCITENFFVAKIDSFEKRNDIGDGKMKNTTGGMLSILHQQEDNIWIVMNRHTNESKIFESNIKFVNNHFWNCYETNDTKELIIDSVTATNDYLDVFFEHELSKNTTNWEKIFKKPQRCMIDLNQMNNENDDIGHISCKNLFNKDSDHLYFDYPTFNSLYKMRNDYQYFYGISPKNLTTSRLFDSVIKFNAQSGDVIKKWYASSFSPITQQQQQQQQQQQSSDSSSNNTHKEYNNYVMEANFIPRPTELAEDDGILITILYNNDLDQSFVIMIDASSMELIDSYKLDIVIPFFAHGMNCFSGKCYPNP